LHMVGVGYAGV